MSNGNSELLFCIGARLREERESLGETQESIASKLGITSKTWSKYESGKTSPTTMTLVELGLLRFDVGYILTGIKSPISNLTPQESALVENYRAASPERRTTLTEVGIALAQSSVNKDELQNNG